MSVITTGSFPKALIKVAKDSFGLSYNEKPAEYSRIFTKVSSDKAYEEYVSMSGFGLATAKGEGAKLTYDSARQGFVTRLTNVTYATGFTITREAMDDLKFLKDIPKSASALGFAFAQTKEVVGGLVLSRAFTSTYSGGDGLELCSLLHVNKAGGTYANELTTGADLSQTSIEDLLTLIGTAEDDRGLVINLRPQALVVRPADEWEARRILESAQQSNTANNATNVLSGIFPKGVVVNHYYDAGNGAFFITTDAMDGLIYQERTPVEFGMDKDSDTFNTKFFGFERYAFGWGDPRGVYGSVGAA